MPYEPEFHWFVITDEHGLILTNHGPFWHDSRGAVDFPSWQAAKASAKAALAAAPGLVSHGVIHPTPPTIGIHIRDLFPALAITRENVLSYLTPDPGEPEKWVSFTEISIWFGCRGVGAVRSSLLSLLVDLEHDGLVARKSENDFQLFGLDYVGIQIQKALTLGYVDVD